MTSVKNTTNQMEVFPTRFPPRNTGCSRWKRARADKVPQRRPDRSCWELERSMNPVERMEHCELDIDPQQKESP